MCKMIPNLSPNTVQKDCFCLARSLQITNTLILTYLWFVQALGARCLWFYEKFWGVFWDYDTAQRHVFSSEAHGIGSSFAQRHSYQKYFKILKARGTESAQSLWCMEFYFISHNMSQWGWVISKKLLFIISLSMDPNPKEWQVPPPSRMWKDSSILQHQLYELVQSSSSLHQHFAVQACVPASCDDSSSSWKWKSWNKFDTEGFDDLFYAEEATYCSRKSLVFFRNLPPHTSSPHLWQHASSLCGPSDRPLSL